VAFEVTCQIKRFYEFSNFGFGTIKVSEVSEVGEIDRGLLDKGDEAEIPLFVVEDGLGQVGVRDFGHVEVAHCRELVVVELHQLEEQLWGQRHQGPGDVQPRVGGHEQAAGDSQQHPHQIKSVTCA
jgi:hypothetical protein